MKRMILIDFSWLYNKYYYVASYSTAQNGGAPEEVPGVLLNMLYQFIKLIGKSYPGDKVIMALDSPTRTLKNFQIFEGYKQHRDTEAKKEVYAPLEDTVKQLASLLNPELFYFIRAKQYESDQILAYIVKKYCEKKEIIIYSGDKDLLQLTAYPNVYVADKFEKGAFLIKSDNEIFLKFKNSRGDDFTRISTNKKDILKYRVLKGDPSDNLSPVFPRIKDTEIVDIIKNYWIDEEALTSERINDIIDDLKGDNAKLAEKLSTSVDIWLRNYRIMDLLHVDDIKLGVLKGRENKTKGVSAGSC